MENYVGKLKEYADKRSKVLKFDDVGSTTEDNVTTFIIRAVFDGQTYVEGLGRTKKEAKQKAAKNAWISLTGDLTPPTNTTEIIPEVPTSTVFPALHNNYTCWLNEYIQKEKLTFKVVETPKAGPNLTTRWCHFVVGDKQYPGAYGNTKKEAKEEAAKQVHNEICGHKPAESGDEKTSGTANQPTRDLNQSVPITDTKRKSLLETNFIGRIDEHCKKTGCLHSFIEENTSGPPHDRQFFYKLRIKDEVFPVGVGKNIKEAKHHAAQLAWAVLQEQSHSNSKGAVKSAPCDESPAPKLSGQTSSLDSGYAKASMRENLSDSNAFTNSSKPSKEQDRSPAVKPKIKLAANFKNADADSKEIIMPNFKRGHAENIRQEETSTQSGHSRFTSDFDSIEHLGRGAFGCVFKAKRKLLDKYYAVKIVPCKETALREVGALSNLHHPNIVRFYNCWLEDSDFQLESSSGSCSSSQKYLYIVMELCAARTLRVWIDEKNVQNVKKSLRDSRRRDESLTFAEQIVSGVEYIHSKMLFHRDLKPANLMFGQDGEVKIGDFGLVVTESYDTDNLVERSEYKGTPSYMAPEQKNKTTYDRKVDIFALGLIYFEMLWNLSTGHEKDGIWKEARNQNLPLAFCQHFSRECFIIKSMLNVKPEDRPEATQLKTELEKFRNEIEACEQRTC